MGKVIKRITRPIKKLIPKEIKPALPYIAAFYGGPAMAGSSFMSGIGNAALRNAISKGLISGATAAATDDNANILRSAALGAAPDLISGGLGNVAGRIDPNLIVDSDEFIKVGKTAAKTAGALSRASEGIKGASALKTIGTQASIDSAAKLAEINQDEIDKYNEELRKQGVLDKTKRRTSILNIYLNAGYEPDYVNSMLDRYGYDEGGIVKALKALRAKMKAPETVAKMSDRLRSRKPENLKDTKKQDSKEPKDDDDEPVKVRDVGRDDLAGGLMAAARGVEQAFGRPFGNIEPVRMLRFARGGEVEIEEETEDLGIRDFMKDQGVPFGEMVSNEQNDQLLELLFEKYLEMGLSPKDAAEAARNEFDRMVKKPEEGIMRVASAYKTDIEEMYEQYVFEMEELGLQPMSFREFVDQARSGMADGGIMSLEEYFEGKRKYQNKKDRERMREEYEDYRNRMKYGPRDEAKDGGRAGYRKGGAIMKLINMGMDPSMALSLYEDWKDSGSGLSFEDYVGYGTIDNYKDGGGIRMASAPDPAAERNSFLEMMSERLYGKPLKNLTPDEFMDLEEALDDMGMKPMPKGRTMAAGGGLMNLGGMEMDLRGGGFVPLGAKEKADDVPARLSKNEFVFTADAVRAAGGGSVDKGADKMYATMKALENKVA